jgi:hypothetical protein
MPERNQQERMYRKGKFLNLKKSILVFFLIFSSLTSFSQFGEKYLVNGSIAHVTDVEVYDLDGDGDLDVLFASWVDNKVAWIENNGEGNYDEHHLISLTTADPQNVIAADLDGDGDLDVAVASTVDNKVTWYANDGNGNFGPSNLVSSGVNDANSVDAVDIDEDGDIDLVASAMGSGKVVWFENDGLGSFGSENIISSTIYGVTNSYAFDLDGDGDFDVLSAGGSISMIVWNENDGDGNFGANQIITSETNQPQDVQAADFDGDGDLDVVSASSYDDRIAWYENVGGGVFGPQQIITDDADYAVRVIVGDMNGDGFVDIISASIMDDILAWYQNDGTGVFGTAQIIETEDNSYVNYCIFPVDMDDDGDLDIVAASDQVTDIKDKITWHENNGTGVFTESHVISTSIEGAFKVFSGDIDGDGDQDLLTGSVYDYKLGWSENDGNGRFIQHYMISVNSGLRDMKAVDLDNDGDLDVLAAYYTTNIIGWYENLGLGVFGPLQIITNEANGAIDVLAEDIDLDGDLDVFSASELDNKIAWYENDGSGEFVSTEIISTDAIGVYDLCLKDLDGDEDDDMLAALEGGNDLIWQENLGGGSFGPAIFISTTVFGAMNVVSDDIDLDDDNDVVVISAGEGQISWFPNNGDGSFASEIIITSGVFSPNNILLCDFDSDGDLDLFSSSNSDNKLAWYVNDGISDFGPQLVISNTTPGLRWVHCVDVDDDGDKDIITASYNDSRLIIIENQFFYEEQVRGRLFIDSNENGAYDSLEVGLALTGVFSTPESDFTYTYDNGVYLMNFTPEFGTYIIEPEEVPHWSLSTDPDFYTILVDTSFTFMDSLDFGFVPDSLITVIEPTLTGGFPRCNTIVNYWMDFRNKGTTMPTGFVKLVLDDSIDFVGATIPPDSIIDQTVYWHYDSLLYFSNMSIDVFVEMPTVEILGGILSSYVHIFEIDEFGDIIYSSGDTLNQILACAYDPNDKLVFPKGEDVLGYIPPSTEMLDYTIRFQNTGTDTALTVVVKDQLDPNLDWSTLNPIAFSHDVHIKVEETGEIIFTFENIMLPDSNVNELESHGFARFKIDLNEGIPLGTSIYNHAEIYFDANSAIITNTTINTVDCWAHANLALEGEADNLICAESGLINVLTDRPGGEFSGTGMIDSQFDPSIAGVGDFEIIYARNPGDGCIYEDTLSVTVVDCLGLPDLGQNYFTIFPNPFDNYTTIKFGEALQENHTIIISNILGQVVYRNENVTGSQLEIKKEQLGVGVYILTVFNSNLEQIYTAKLVVN